MKASVRLEVLKEEYDNIGWERFVSLTNPKNVSLMESVIAWTCCGVPFNGDVEVPDDASMDDLWKLCKIELQSFSEASGLNIQECFPKIHCMQKLGFIYPDGTANSRALSIIKMYIKGKVQDMA